MKARSSSRKETAISRGGKQLQGLYSKSNTPSKDPQRPAKKGERIKMQKEKRSPYSLHPQKKKKRNLKERKSPRIKATSP